MIKQVAIISNWGQYPKVRATLTSFKSTGLIQKKIRSSISYSVRGLGRSYGDSSLYPDIISTQKYDRILQFDQAGAMITCQSGVTFESLIQFLVPKGLFLPVTPGTKFITVGGAVASDIHGKNHHVEGSFGNHVERLTILLASGNVVECSKDVEPDLFTATCGGMGLTGLILTVKFRLKKIDNALIRQTSIKARNLDEIFDLFEKYKNNTYSVAWIDCLQRGNALGRSLLMVGEHAEKSESSPLPVPGAYRSKKNISIPFNFPTWVLNTYSIMIFNFLFYHKQLRKKRETLVNFDQFFYPLDFIGSWNRMYGKRGFVQYQFVLPLEHSKEGLREILTAISKNGTGSFLAVLKLFGEQESGLISFPMKGYTLALDFPVKKGLFEFLDQLDQLVLRYGGRIYLTKDARMSKDVFWHSYPMARQFQQIIKKFNPNFTWRSAQSDRLEISKA